MNRDSLLGIHMVILYNYISFILHRICICNELLIVAQNQNSFSKAGGQLSFKPFTVCTSTPCYWCTSIEMLPTMNWMANIGSGLSLMASAHNVQISNIKS